MAQSVTTADLKADADEACKAAEEFCSIFIETMDKKRHMMQKLYNDSAELIWNGNYVKSATAISDFLSNLPESYHNCSSLDSQPVNVVATNGQKAIIVVMEGSISFEGHPQNYFTQNFILTAKDQHWKIATHCYRFIDD